VFFIGKTAAEFLIIRRVEIGNKNQACNYMVMNAVDKKKNATSLTTDVRVFLDP